MIDLRDKTILLTGGTGSFGTAFCMYLQKNNNIPERLAVYSRDWQKQKELCDKLGNPKWLTCVIGDVATDNLKSKLTNIGFDYVIHAAAIKDIVACEKNSLECVRTNILGTQNVIDYCKYDSFVEKAILISTDKAVNPINTYGVSKKMAEKLWINSNNINLDKIFTVCRYGNVIGSNGSVLPYYRKLIADGATSLPVTDERCTRFWYPMNDAIEFVLSALENYEDDLLIPKIPSIRITDLCKALDMPYHIIGLRPFEKIHEYMIPPDDATSDEGYSSGNNPHFLTVEEIRRSIQDA